MAETFESGDPFVIDAPFGRNVQPFKVLLGNTSAAELQELGTMGIQADGEVTQDSFLIEDRTKSIWVHFGEEESGDWVDFVIEISPVSNQAAAAAIDGMVDVHLIGTDIDALIQMKPHVAIEMLPAAISPKFSPDVPKTFGSMVGEEVLNAGITREYPYKIENVLFTLQGAESMYQWRPEKVGTVDFNVQQEVIQSLDAPIEYIGPDRESAKATNLHSYPAIRSSLFIFPLNDILFDATLVGTVIK